jgi:hypothetical protein
MNIELIKDPKTLRIATIVVLLHAILVTFSQMLLLIGTFVREDNPLPDALADYVAFPIYFLMPLFIGIIVYSSRTLLKKSFNYKVVLWLTVFSILYFAFGGELYSFIQALHPYHDSVS